MRPLAHSSLFVLAVVALVLVARAFAAVPPAARPVGPTGIVLPAADPMATELQAELERGQHDYAALFRQLATARSETEAFEVQEAMRQQRTGVQVALLRIQAAYAHREGRERLAAQLERAIAELVAPGPARREATPERGRM